jgi:hypothetical protein
MTEIKIKINLNEGAFPAKQDAEDYLAKLGLLLCATAEVNGALFDVSADLES